MQKGMGKSVDRKWAGSGFILVEPQTMADSDMVAKKLVACDGVDAVHLTSGRYGFVVLAKPRNANIDALGELDKRVRKLGAGIRTEILANHYTYRKR